MTIDILDKRAVMNHLLNFVSMEPNTGCWLWIGGYAGNGYAHFNLNGKGEQGHRISYRMSVGEIPYGLDLDHKCRVRICVNPFHVEPVTRIENVRRGLKGILTTHCPKGHPYDEINTRLVKTKTGLSRQCRKCGRIDGPRIDNPYVLRQKAKTHCPKGHEYTPENTGIYNGCRQCKECSKIRIYAARNKNRFNQIADIGFKL